MPVRGASSSSETLLQLCLSRSGVVLLQCHSPSKHLCSNVAMVGEFVIPKHAVKQVLGESTCNAPVADVLDDLNNHDALFITEEGEYERCEAMARGFLQLNPSDRSTAVDVLTANLRYICTSAQQLLSAEDQPSPETLQKHRNGLKMVVHLLHIIAMHANRDAELVKGTENAAVKPAKGTGRGRKAAADEGSQWDWQHSRQQVLAAVHEVTRTDLPTLFKGVTAAERMVNLCMELALQALESPSITKQDGAWPACCDVLIRGAVYFKQEEFVAAALMERARKHEHLPPLAAQAAKYAEDKYNSTQLAVMLLAEFWSSSPEDYDTQYANNPRSVRQAGEVVALLADLLPKVVSNHISQLRPYLACAKASSIRATLMAATGSVLLQVYPSSALNSSLGAGAAQAHLRSKETLLGLLHARILDKAAYVRQRVLQTWAKLVEESCVPLNHWNILLAQAVGRLEDDSQLVVKAALQLLCKMLHQGLFPPALDAQRYINSLRLEEAKLEALLPAGQRQHKGSLGEGTRSDTKGGGGEEDAVEDRDTAATEAEEAWAEGAIKVEAAADAALEDDDQEEGADDQQHANHAAISCVRTMVASLKEGVAFCKRLAASLRQVQVLLTSPKADVVHDAIVFLTLCKTYEVTGAAKALRGMWPLVFSKGDDVKGAVLDSWHILHLHNRTPKEQVAELVTEVIPGCSLAELTALEAILAALAQQGSLSASTLVHLLFQDMCHYFTKLQQHQQVERERRRQQRGGDSSTAEPATEMHIDTDAGDTGSPAAAGANAETVEMMRSDIVDGLRHVFTLLSMLSAAQPDAIKAKYVPVLLEVAFSTDLADAWVARHACITLRHAAPHLVPAPLPSSITAAAASSSSRAPVNPVSPESHQAVLAAVVRLLVGHPAASMAPNWHSAAEAAVPAVYVLSPRPQEVMAAVLEEMFRRCRPASNSTGPYEANGDDQQQQALPGFSAAALSRFFFVLGRTSLQHLLCIESLGKAIRQARLTAGRAAAEAADRAREAATAAGGKRGGGKAAAVAAAAAAQQADDIAGMLGSGAVTADAELDDLVEQIEAQMMSQQQLLGRYGSLLSKMVHLRAFITYPQELQAAALLALTQLMAVDGAYCSDNVAVLFTLLHKRLVSAPVRVNMVVALADLASCWPNVLEPWTAYMYEPLSDPEPTVKLSALSSLTHLVLGGMVKAKGNVAKVAMLLVDDDQELVDRAVLFFDNLAQSGSGTSRTAGSAAAGASAANPVYNLLPDCLSALLAKDDPPLREEQMHAIMTQLLGYVKDKQAESLRERLVVRLQLGGPREWRLVAWCLNYLGYSEKGLKRVMEMTACYRHTLGEQQVFDVFMSMARKAAGAKAVSAAAANEAPSSQGLPGDLTSSVQEWVAELVSCREAAVEAAEVEALTAKQQKQQQEEKEGMPQAEAEERQQHQQQEAEGDGEGHAAAEAKVQQDMQHCEAQSAAQDSAAQQGESDTAAGTAATPMDGSTDPQQQEQQQEDQQLDLVQSQDLVSNVDLEPALLEAAAAAVATAGIQRMSLAGGARASSAAAAAARGQRSVAASASTAASGAAARSSARGSRQGSKAGGTSSTASRQAGKKAVAKGKGRGDSEDDSDGDSTDGSSSSDSGSSDDGSSAAAAVARRGAAGGSSSWSGTARGTSAGGSTAAGAGGARGVRSSRRSAAPAVQPKRAASTADSSSEDDD